MKNSRSVSPSKSTARMPAGPLSPDHLSAVAAFEQWQRESPRVIPRSADEPDSDAADRKLKN